MPRERCPGAPSDKRDSVSTFPGDVKSDPEDVKADRTRRKAVRSVCLSIDRSGLLFFVRENRSLSSPCRDFKQNLHHDDGIYKVVYYGRVMRRHAEAESRINNSCYKVFRYGDIDYVHRLCRAEGVRRR